MYVKSNRISSLPLSNPKLLYEEFGIVIVEVLFIIYGQVSDQ